MRRTSTQARRGGRSWALIAVGAILAGASLLHPAISQAQVPLGGATPTSGSVGPVKGSSTTWQFDPVAGAGSGGTPLEVECAPGHCSKFALTVNLPSADFYQHYIATMTFHCSWSTPDAGGQGAGDVDCFTFSPTGGETGPGSPDTSTPGANFEDITIIDPQPGVWSLRADAGTVPVPTAVDGIASITWAPATHPPLQLRQPGDPRFTNYDFTQDPNFQTKDGAGRPNAGEPSLGIDQATGAVMYMAGNQVSHLAYDHGSPPQPALTNITPPNSVVNEDAILYTDHDTNRTWALGLLLAGSYLAYSDNDGASWTPSVAFSPPALPDHETLGSGPYRPGTSGSYAHAVYYCAQTIEQDAYCGRSDNGGMTFNAPAVALWHGACSPIHGHVRVGPTGIVYVPNSSCSETDASGNTVTHSGVAVSLDNGGSFTVSQPPDSSPGKSDPSVMEGPDGTVYFGYQASNGHPMIATATHNPDGSLKWNPSVDVGRFQNPGESEDALALGVQNTEFAEVITGDAGRAAFAFLGTGLPGNDQGADYAGTWYLYISFTYDGGKTWRTVNATPHDPVQRGCVWNGGLINACRNMLDFNDIGVDKQGHVYVAYTDGCTTTADYSCDNTPGIYGWNNATSGTATSGCMPSETSPPITSTSTCTFARVSAIVRQVCGRGLVAASDPGFNESPDCATTASSNTGITSGGGTSSGVQGTTATALPNTAPAGTPQWAYAALMLGGAGLGVAARRRRRRRLDGGLQD